MRTIFANPNDKSASDLNLALRSNQTAYFCYGDNASHLVEKALSTEATCENPKMTANYCFCGQIVGKPKTEGDALGHSYKIYLGIVYESYMEEGYKKYECDRCGNVSIDEKSPALFTCLGYSAPEDGKGGITIGFKVNNIAIKDYEEITGKTLKYGVFAVSLDKLQGGDIFENGVANENAICAEIKATEFSAFDLKITGFEDSQKETKLALGAYVATTDDEGTEYSYM